MRRASRDTGFTIVELLIVIVVIGILAGITIVAYSGVTQKASSTSINVAIDQWAGLIGASSVGTGYKLQAATCMGRSTSDFPATDDFASGACVTVDGVTTMSYVPSAFTSWPSDQVRPSGLVPTTQTISSGGSVIKARGVWVGGYSSTFVTLRWITSISDDCAKGTVYISNGPGSTAGGMCGYNINISS